MKTTTITNLPNPSLDKDIYEGIDLTYLKSISEGSKEFEKEMLQALITNMDSKVEILSAYVLEKNANSICMQAHSLKTLSNIMGITALYEQFRDMELKHAENEYTSDTEQEFAEAEATWQQARLQVIKIIETY